MGTICKPELDNQLVKELQILVDDGWNIVDIWEPNLDSYRPRLTLQIVTLTKGKDKRYVSYKYTG